MASGYARGGLGWILVKIYRKSGQTLEEAAYGGGGITGLGIVQKTRRHGT